MNDFLMHPYFAQAGIPLLGASLGVGVKYVTRNDRHVAFKKEDLAVGLDLIVTACVAYAMILADRGVKLKVANGKLAEIAGGVRPPSAGEVERLQQEVTLLSERTMGSGWTVLGLVLALWAVSTIVRKWGWTGPDELHTGWGIILPVAVGVIMLSFVMTQAVL